MRELIKQVAEKRSRLASKSGSILKRAQSEKRELTPEEVNEVDALHAELESLKAELSRLQAQLEVEEEVLEELVEDDEEVRNEVEDEEEENRNEVEDEEDEENRKEKRSFLPRPQRQNVGQAQRRKTALAKDSMRKFLRGERLTDAEKRSINHTTAGTTLPGGMTTDFWTVLREKGVIRELNPYLNESENGNTTPFPRWDDTSNVGEIVVANATDPTTSATPTDGVLNLGGYEYSSKKIPISHAFIQDAPYDVVAMVVQIATERIAAIRDAHAFNGTGSGQPAGAVGAVSVGKTTTANNAITYNEILELIHSLPRNYRANATMVMNDKSLLAVRQLVDSSSNPIFHWLPDNAAGDMKPTIAGIPYVIDPSMDDIGVAKKPIIIGDFSKGFILRDVMNSVRLHIDNITNGTTVFYTLYSRGDSGVVVPGAFRTLQNKTT